MLMPDLSTITAYFQIIGSIATGFGALAILLAYQQLKHTRKETLAQTLLTIDQSLRNPDLDDVRQRFATGDLATGNPKVQTGEWSPIITYMGLFERIKIIKDQGLVGIGIVNSLYGSRLKKIVANEQVRKERLTENGKPNDSWRLFNELWGELYKAYPGENYWKPDWV